MKNLFKVFGLIALVAIIGFSMAACDTGGDDGGGTKGGLTAPTGLTATPYSSSSIILTWNAVAGATGYNVYNGTSPSALGGPGSVTTNYATNYNLPANTTVYYQIAAYNANGEGPRSSVVSATTLSANNYSLNGVWDYSGYLVTVNGSNAVLNEFRNPISVLLQSAINKGYIKRGDIVWKNIKSTGNLTWTADIIGITFDYSNPNVATGTGWYYNQVITMSNDGQTLTGGVTATRK